MVTDGVASQIVSQLGLAATPGGAASGGAQSFTAAFEQAKLRQADSPDASSLKTVLSPLFALGEQSVQLTEQAGPLASNEYRPSELMMITMRSHEFLFRCELTANVANRASDGVQQLFRQQS